MQLIISRGVPFITPDRKLVTKTSTLIDCQVVSADLDLNCIVGAMRLVNSGMTTANKVEVTGAIRSGSGWKAIETGLSPGLSARLRGAGEHAAKNQRACGSTHSMPS